MRYKEVTGHCKETSNANLDCVYVENTPVFIMSLNWGESWLPLGPFPDCRAVVWLLNTQAERKGGSGDCYRYNAYKK